MNTRKTRVLVLTDSYPIDGISESFFSEEGSRLNEVFDAVFAPSSFKRGLVQSHSPEFAVIRAREFRGLRKVFAAFLHFPWLEVAKELSRKPSVLASPGRLARLLLEALQVGLRIASLGKVAKVDLIYSFWGRSDAVVASILSRKTGAAFAFRNHNFDLYEERFQGYIPFKRYLARANGLGIYLSEDSAHYARKRFGHSTGIVRPLGATLTFANSSDEPKSLESFISVSYISPVKRIGFLASVLREFSSLSGRIVSWTHVGGSSEEFSRAVFSALDSTSRVKVSHLESQPPNLMARILRDSEAGIFFNSSAHEGMPVSILEAMHSQKVIVAPAVGDVPALLSGTGNLIFDPASSAELVAAQLFDWLKHLNPRETGEKNATLAASRFDSSKCAKETIEALNDWVVSDAVRE